MSERELICLLLILILSILTADGFKEVAAT
jgi:hypothetical protein